MKFIALLVATSLNFTTPYKTQELFENQFKYMYVKVSDIENIWKRNEIRYFDRWANLPSRENYTYVCEISLRDQIVYVRQDCDSLIEKINHNQ